MTDTPKYKTIIGTTHSGYIKMGPLKDYLKEKYPSETYGDYQFEIQERNDRFFFYLPVKLEKEDVTKMAVEVGNICRAQAPDDSTT